MRYRVLPGGRRVRDRRVTAPTGSIAEILAAVGTDAAIARAALEAERASENPRVSLISKLESLTDA